MTYSEQATLDRILAEFNGKVNGIETVPHYMYIDNYAYLGKHYSLATDGTNSYRGIVNREHVVISLPVDTVDQFVMLLTTKLHPTDEDIQSMTAKRKLYDSNPYFKDLYDQLVTYFSLVRD